MLPGVMSPLTPRTPFCFLVGQAKEGWTAAAPRMCFTPFLEGLSHGVLLEDVDSLQSRMWTPEGRQSWQTRDLAH